MKPWDKDDYAEFEGMHTVVTMVKKDARGRDIKKKEILQGSVGKIFSAKVNGKFPSRILISALAGRGKTTAVAKMAHDWVHREEGSGLEDLPLLFVVKFRNTSHSTSIGEAIISQLLGDVDDLTPEGLESFIRQHQGVCHIVLDGLDEYAGVSSSSNIMRILRREMFPRCRVLVTTRPHLEYIFSQGDLPWVYTKMEIEGFSRDSSHDYIDRFFASVQKDMKANALKVYLDEQPLIEELVKTPLFCLMVCHLWSEDLLQRDTTTQTELLDQVNVFLMLHANARTPGLIKNAKQLNKIILKLGEIALTGLINDAKKLVFSSCDFQRVPSIFDMACALGIVSKNVVSTRRLPQLDEAFPTTTTNIEFYHKLAQEHAAGKYLAKKTNRFLLLLKSSKLDRVLRDINTSIGEYENLIRFSSGTKSNLCIRIMENVLTNSYLSESERYRILLDCSSESGVNDGNVSSLVRRCVTSRRMILKSPTVYTIVGMLNIPRELKEKVVSVEFEQSTMGTAVTDGLWACLKSFPMLTSLTISDSSIDFPPSPPELPSITSLSVKGVTSQCYKGLISMLPCLTDIADMDITIDDAEGDIAYISASFRRTGGQKLERIILRDAPSSFPSRKSSFGTETEGGLRLLYDKDATNMLILHSTKHSENKGPVELLESFAFLASLAELELEFLDDWSFNFKTTFGVKITKCQLSPEMTTRIWSCLSSFTSLNHLNISDSSIDFPQSPPELPSITSLSVKGVTSQCFEGLISMLPCLTDIADMDITIDDAEGDIAYISASFRRTGGQKLERISLRDTPSSFPSQKSPFWSETEGGLRLLFDKRAANMLILHSDKHSENKGPVEVLESFAFLASLAQLKLEFLDGWSFNFGTTFGVKITKCQLSPEMTTRIWSCLRSFTSLNDLTISDSSLSFTPSPPELPSITSLSVKGVTSQCYKGLISMLPCLTDIVDMDITIDDAEEDIDYISASLRRTGGKKLDRIIIRDTPSSFPSRKSSFGTETEGGPRLLFDKHATNMLTLHNAIHSENKGAVEVLESFAFLASLAQLELEFLDGWSFNFGTAFGVKISKCQLTLEMAKRMWSCLSSFTSLNHLHISFPSLSFFKFPPELQSIRSLSVEGVTLQNYRILISSLPGFVDIVHIDITIDDPERDIAFITAGLRQNRRQKLTNITLRTLYSLPIKRCRVSSETLRGLSLLIKEHTKNLMEFYLGWVKCAYEDDLVYLIECCRYVKTMERVE
ncbi:uncharacterized protein LOC121416863 [Lytechinus variegatus]|uniref:uncharacterized protein LOC121416863 n=1 Tax=Lytechinus variegatus TaxID=7654 RepID=UPI001BB16785|nr:uncharacterized protein LOC121416863 [Lytechinus variegatus]